MKSLPNQLLIAPSILSADPMNFREELASIEKAGADWHHVDVMDGHFVPNLTFGPSLIRAIKKESKLPLDVHIMVSNPDAVALEYVSAGADVLVFHIEAVTHGHRLCAAIRAAGASPGVALNPGTSVSAIAGLLPYVDLVLVMSVNPGFGGQSFIPEAVKRVTEVKSLLIAAGLQDRVRIEVDGGINSETAKQVVAAGASVLVAGSFVYGHKSRKDAIASLRATPLKKAKK